MLEALLEAGVALSPSGAELVVVPGSSLERLGYIKLSFARGELRQPLCKTEV